MVRAGTGEAQGQSERAAWRKGHLSWKLEDEEDKEEGFETVGAASTRTADENMASSRKRDNVSWIQCGPNQQQSLKLGRWVGVEHPGLWPGTCALS